MATFRPRYEVFNDVRVVRSAVLIKWARQASSFLPSYLPPQDGLSSPPLCNPKGNALRSLLVRLLPCPSLDRMSFRLGFFLSHSFGFVSASLTLPRATPKLPIAFLLKWPILADRNRCSPPLAVGGLRSRSSTFHMLESPP